MDTRLTLVTGPTEEPIDLESAKAHLRVTDNEEDNVINGLIKASRAYAEKYLRRQFVSATYALRMDLLPWKIVLPIPPLQSVTSITYVDFAGATQTISSSDYTVERYGEPGFIVAAYNLTWPTVRGHVNDVCVTFVAGYGAATAVPASIKQAMLLLIGSGYENKEAAVVDQGFSALDVPFGVEALLDSERWGFYA